MSGNESSIQVFLKNWEGFDDRQRRTILYLFLAPPPVSIDTLCSLASVTAVEVLNLVTGLVEPGLVAEKKEYGRGVYFPNTAVLQNSLVELVTPEEKEKIMRRVLEFCHSSLEETRAKTLAIAELYVNLGRVESEAIDCIRRAADILLNSGLDEKAASYCIYLMESAGQGSDGSAGSPGSGMKDLLNFVVDRFASIDDTVSPGTRTRLLTRALEVAGEQARRDAVTRIELALGQILIKEGRRELAMEYIADALTPAREFGGEALWKSAVLTLGNALFQQGRLAEAVLHYEKTKTSTDDCGDDGTSLKADAILAWCLVVCGRISRGLDLLDGVQKKALALGLNDVAVFADLMNALAHIEMRKVDEAEEHLRRVLDNVTNIDPDVLPAAHCCAAFIQNTRGEFSGAAGDLAKASACSVIPDTLYCRGSHIFESIHELERKGLSNSDCSFSGVLERALNGDDIYMKGIAYRYRALEGMKDRQSRGRAFLDLRKSEKYLTEAGAEVELARTWIAMGDAYLREGEIKVAQSHLKKAWELFSRVGPELFPKDLAVILMPPDEKMEFMIDRIIHINKSLGTIRDRSAFLERTIGLVMGFTTAVRGAFFIVESGVPRIAAGRNLDPLMLKAGQFNLITRVMEHVSGKNSEAVMPGIPAMDGMSDNSFFDAGINSFICMPAGVGDQTQGYLYLDNRLSGPFTESQLPFVRLLCSQIAVGLSNITMYEEMKELKNRFEDEATFYRQEMGIGTPVETIIGNSGGIKAVKEAILQVAPTDSSVLLLGETGVGKELVAKAIHNLSTRKNGPFIPVNLAALPQELVASELFGHERGAFTGAHERLKGRFELADNGTIFLDEIGDLPQVVQVKLLRVLQEGTFERLGSAKPIRSNFRVIAATHRNLAAEVGKGAFRQDLYYRLDVFPILVPSLRERKDDIPLLARYFTEKFSRKMGKRITRIPPEELKKLVEYHWPGNVRELEHFIERAVILCDSEKISFSRVEYPSASRPETDGIASPSMADVERTHICKVLMATNWKISGPHGAASLLGLKPTTLLSRMKKLGIARESRESVDWRLL